MINELRLFNYEGKDMLAVIIDGDLWWLVEDVLDVLMIGFNGPTAMQLDSEDFRIIEIVYPQDNKEPLEVEIVDNFGLLYSMQYLNKKKVKDFTRWVTHDVLPSVRKEIIDWSKVPPNVLEELQADPIVMKRIEQIDLFINSLNKNQVMLGGCPFNPHEI